MIEVSTLIEGAKMVGSAPILIVIIKYFFDSAKKKLDKIEEKVDQSKEEIEDFISKNTVRMDSMQERMFEHRAKSMSELQSILVIKDLVTTGFEEIRKDNYEERSNRIFQIKQIEEKVDKNSQKISKVSSWFPQSTINKN